ncbi:hemerythrin domain-containing protein [Uliginosibacterium sp. H3]|uniref:Hemerythrin domain-containing protein n=1 Tax=Uliginosibacterium silvisoli TaxID=3114758 RepID=A0ABU6K089_9RHOO|nr:hemerythrin domain-containing protein [Uliginosibacterium sp. H3]
MNTINTVVIPGFEDPRAMLLACHDKVRHFARLAARLEAHVADKGADSEASHAAKGILRYFNLAAPLHHDDEELDLFPALRGLGSSELDSAINRLESEHEELAALWASIRPWLEATAHNELVAAPASVTEFARRYVLHAGAEETEVYGAMADLPPEVIAAIGRSMCARRGLS